jgi:hypothetical protein
MPGIYRKLGNTTIDFMEDYNGFLISPEFDKNLTQHLEGS